jgi:hypothetical protein
MLLRWMQAAADYPSLTKEQRLDILVRFLTYMVIVIVLLCWLVLRHLLHCAVESDG